MKKTRGKKYSIIIAPDDGSKIREYTISQRGVQVLKVVSICIFLGIVGLFFEYGSIIQKNLKIRSLEAHNKELVERYGKLQAFEEEFKGYKERMLKLANMLGIESRLPSSGTRISVTPKIGETSGLPDGSVPEEQSSDLSSERPTGLPIPGDVKKWLSRSFSSSHAGIDFATSSGTPVLSTMDGIASFAGWSDTLGYLVKVTNISTGYTTLYGHLMKFTVSLNNKISAGDKIGYVGSTGRSSAPHLHYEVWLNGVAQDPKSYLSE